MILFVVSKTLMMPVCFSEYLNSCHPTGFVPFFINKLPGLFQDSYWFFRGSEIHINPSTLKISMLNLLTAFIHFIFLVEFNRFPELSRTSGLFPGLSSPGNLHNKIPVLDRFSRTCQTSTLGSRDFLTSTGTSLPSVPMSLVTWTWFSIVLERKAIKNIRWSNSQYHPGSAN